MNKVAFSEDELLALVRQGDEAAIRALVAQLNPRLFRVARAILHSDADAEDALQDAYIQAFIHLEQFRGDSRFSTWMTRIVINAARMRLRSSRINEEYDTAQERTYNAETSGLTRFPTPEESLLQNEFVQILDDAIFRLPENLRIVFVLKEVQGMKAIEIAELLQLNAVTVKTRLFRARLQLRQTLSATTADSLAHLYGFDGIRCSHMADRVVRELRRVRRPTEPM